jgi:excinuclease ABC subunit C
MDDSISKLRQKALSLPALPGVYLFSDKDGTVIYVGKAKALKNRVTQYFHENNPSLKARVMVENARSLDYIVTSDEFEALILECSLIKRHKPKYNILLKDDKGYPFIRLDPREEYPTFQIVPKKADDGALYFGPYGGRNVAHDVIDCICSALALPVCSRVFPRDIGKERPCLHYQTKKCYGPCRQEEDPAKYKELISQAILYLEGKYDDLVSELTRKMEEAAEALEFERAAFLRDRISNVSRLRERQKIITGSKGLVDAVGYFVGETKIAIAVLSIQNGTVAGSDVRTLKLSSKAEAPEIIEAFLKQYYPGSGRIPDRILTAHRFGDAELLQKLLCDESGKKVELICPRRGVNYSLLRMAEENARQEVLRTTSSEELSSFAVSELTRLTGSSSPLLRIEAFDISNTGGSDIVAAMAVFENGRPDKASYRKYAIRGKTSQDDYFAMAEVLTRRYGKAAEKAEKLPDLILIDGGAGHVDTAKRVFSELGVEPFFLGMVKDDRHRTRALVTPDGQEIGLNASPAAFSLVAAVQEEAHRFAVTYHRQKRSKSAVGSELDSIPGIGKARRAALIKRFKSLKAVRAASVAELAEVIPSNAAAAVHAYFHDGEADGQNPSNGEKPCE